MKVNVSVPPLHLLSVDQISVSSSSQSVCSTMSSFRDPILASFEEELLNSSIKSGSSTGAGASGGGGARTSTSWSNIKGSVCASRHVGINNVKEGVNSKSGSVHGYVGGKRHSQSSKSSQSGGRRQITISISQESDSSAISWKSVRSSSLYHVRDVSDFADSLARTIICESLTTVFTIKHDNKESASDRQIYAMDLYSEVLARDIMSAAMVTFHMVNSDWSDLNKVVTWSDKMECVQYSENNIDDDDTSGRKDADR